MAKFDMAKLFKFFKKRTAISELDSLSEADVQQGDSEKNDRANITPPYLFIAGYFDGSDKKDVIQWIRSAMESMCSSLDHSGYFIIPYLDGFAYEIHEGGSRHSYIKWIIEALDKSSNGRIAIQTATNVVSIEKTSKGFVSLLIPESNHHKEAISQPEAHGSLTNYTIDKTKYVTALMYFFLFSCSLFVFVVILKVIAWSAAKDMSRQVLAQKMEQVPILHWPKDKLPENTYIDQLRYSDGRWSILSKPFTTGVVAKTINDENHQPDAPADQNKQKVIQVPVMSGNKIISKSVTTTVNP